jgi:thymidylate synthase
MNKIENTEYDTKYKELVNHILENGFEQACRNGSQIVIPHYSFNLNFSKPDSYRLNLRKMFYKGVKGEWDTLMDLETPLTNVKNFEDNGCNYWKLWGGPNGELNLDYYNMLHPQLEDIIEQIKTDPGSRRHLIELWNHEHVMDQVNPLSLTSCWHGMTFSVINGKLHLAFSIRSNDVMLGNPADVYLAYMFMEHVANETNLEMGNCQFNISNVHIYSQHREGAIELLTRTGADFDKSIKFELLA